MFSSREFEWLAALRRYEVETVFARARVQRCRLLEVGGGAGHQAKALADLGHDVSSIDLPDSDYAPRRIFPVLDYDGTRIPFGDGAFDLVYSSNVLEHVAHLDSLEREMQRVTRPGGSAIHVVPTHHWRLWTSAATGPALARLGWRTLGARLTHRPEGVGSRALRDRLARADRTFPHLLATTLGLAPHGARGSAIHEYLSYFRPTHWIGHFRAVGWTVEDAFPLGVFYTGHALAAGTLGFRARAALGGVFGSATWAFVLRRPD